MLAELLKRLTELEPEICQSLDEPHSHWYVIRLRGEGEPIDSKDPGKYALAYLQLAVQDAIVDRNLRCRIENAPDGWFVTLTDSTTTMPEFFPVHHDKECAVALLKAYISYLEGRKAAPT